MKKRFNLQLFDDGGQSGSAGQSGTAGSNGNGGQTSAGTNGASYSFEQAEEIANARAQRAERAALANYFKQQGLSEDEITKAIADYKNQQAAKSPNIEAITKERDDARKELAAMKNGATLRSKGVKDEDMDYVLFKIGKLMDEDDKLDFDKAAAKFLKENPRYAAAGSGNSYRVKTGTDGSTQSGGSGKGENAAINAAIRNAARR